MANRLVFVSYGVLTEEERRLGAAAAGIIRAHRMEPFIAQEVHSANDLNSRVFDAINNCDAFLGILHKRGLVRFRTYPDVDRSSVWIQQEFAVFCYRSFVERRALPMRIYMERGIRREGVMEIAMANPIEFEQPDEVLAELDRWLEGPEFHEHPIQARREQVFRRRLAEAIDIDVVVAGAVHLGETHVAHSHSIVAGGLLLTS